MAIHRVSVQLTEREYWAAKQVSAAFGQSLASYLRNACVYKIREQSKTYSLGLNYVGPDDPEPRGRRR